MFLVNVSARMVVRWLPPIDLPGIAEKMFHWLISLWN
jgi:hypothetical protein